ncbi:HBL/NHE enterotoxin family protein [Bacillus mycoides]|uniref:HBL/NHE enterotoxin family protein n=1 Tax=Bacillus mycoides TaxID=1405 RepID=UPI0021125392|nr:HBL/NHE enterotoxin family protein [Bacillus mycoides]MCQ6530701.1 alpha-helical pore-forming toxin family protein [Bacillus mycoides]
MKKSSFVTGCIITALMAGQAVSSQVFASKKQQTDEQINTPIATSTTSSALQELGTQTVLLKTHALTLLKQPTITIATMPDLSVYQEKAKQHAQYWLDTVQPSFIDANQQLIDFHQKFQNYYKKLIELSQKINTDATARQEFIIGITKLQASLANHQNQIQTMSSNLQKFQGKFGTDAQNFIDASKTAQKSLADKDGEVAQLTQRIETLDSDITAQIGPIVSGTISMIAGIGSITFGTIMLFTTGGTTATFVVPMLAGIVAGTGGLIGGSVTVGFAAKKLEDKRKELQAVTEKLTSAKADAVALSLLTGQLNVFKDTVANGKESVESFDDNWNTLQQNFIELQNNVKQMNPDSAVLQNQLAKIKKSVDDLAVQAKQQEKVITAISYQ